MPTTPNGLRYPGAPESEPPNGPLQIGNLAADVDSHLTALYAGAAGFLSQSQSTSNGNVSSTSMTAIQSITVNVPAGLSASRRIKVTGLVYLSTPSGVGAAAEIQSGSERIFNNQIQGDATVMRYDSSVAAGSRTYTLRVRSTVSGQNVTWRYPYLSVEIV